MRLKNYVYIFITWCFFTSTATSQQTSTISTSSNHQGTATTTYTNTIGTAANQVRIVNDTYDFAKCDFVAQEVCSSGGSYAQCLKWHKKQAGRLNANIISAVTVDNWNRLSHGVIADYYTCRSNQ